MTHISLSAKENRFQAIVRVSNLFRLAHFEQIGQNLLMGQFGVSQNGSSRLNGFFDGIRLNAGTLFAEVLSQFGYMLKQNELFCYTIP